jgi:hypothetical protein
MGALVQVLEPEIPNGLMLRTEDWYLSTSTEPSMNFSDAHPTLVTVDLC